MVRLHSTFPGQTVVLSSMVQRRRGLTSLSDCSRERTGFRFPARLMPSIIDCLMFLEMRIQQSGICDDIEIELYSRLAL
jgi:hypothetical protein